MRTTIADSLLAQDDKRAEEENFLRSRLTALPDEWLADIALLNRVHAARTDEFRREDLSLEHKRENRESLISVLDPIVALVNRQALQQL